MILARKFFAVALSLQLVFASSFASLSFASTPDSPDDTQEISVELSPVENISSEQKNSGFIANLLAIISSSLGSGSLCTESKIKELEAELKFAKSNFSQSEREYKDTILSGRHRGPQVADEFGLSKEGVELGRQISELQNEIEKCRKSLSLEVESSELLLQSEETTTEEIDCPKSDYECGNGVKDPTEQCDGNDGLEIGQTCNSSCEIEEPPSSTPPGETPPSEPPTDEESEESTESQEPEELPFEEESDEETEVTTTTTSETTTEEIDCPKSDYECGNGIKDPTEQCDGNDGLEIGQTCNSSCEIEESPEEPPSEPPSETPPSTPYVCGNNEVEPGEQCDGGSSCNSSCQIIEPLIFTPTPEPGTVSPLFGFEIPIFFKRIEAALQEIIQCGDEIIDSGEQCDDGNAVTGDGCDTSCKIENICGDGNLQSSEQCDDGNTSDGDGCDSSCKVENKCGDGNLQSSEQCDDGNTSSGDGCDSSCKVEPPTRPSACYIYTPQIISPVNSIDINYNYSNPQNSSALATIYEIQHPPSGEIRHSIAEVSGQGSINVPTPLYVASYIIECPHNGYNITHTSTNSVPAGGTPSAGGEDLSPCTFTSFTATDLPGTNIRLQWVPALPNADVYRASTGFTVELIASNQASPYTSTGLSGGLSYDFQVRRETCSSGIVTEISTS